MGGPSGRLRRVQRDGVAKRVELADQLAGLGLWAAADEVLGTGIVVGNASGKDVERVHQDGVADRLGGPGGASPPSEALVLGSEVGVLGPGGGLGGLGAVGPPPLGALSGPSRAP